MQRRGPESNCGARPPTAGDIEDARPEEPLSSISELQSLVDPSATTDFMTLPPAHPFLEVQDDYYWSSTATASSNGGSVFVQGFTTFHHNTGYEKTAQLAMWCVRWPGGGSVQ